MKPWSTPLKGWKSAAVLLGLALLVFLATRTPTSRQPLGEAAPDLRLPDLSGRIVALSDFKDQVVLVNFWATWCEPCQEELPDLVALHKKYKDKGFTVLGINMDLRGKKVVGPWVKNNAVPFPILLTQGEVPHGYNVPGLPASALIDRRGRVARSYLGPRSLDELARDVESTLGP